MEMEPTLLSCTELLCGLSHCISQSKPRKTYFPVGVEWRVCSWQERSTARLVSPERHSTAGLGGDIIVWGEHVTERLRAEFAARSCVRLLAGCLEAGRAGAPQSITPPGATALDTWRSWARVRAFEAGMVAGPIRHRAKCMRT